MTETGIDRPLSRQATTVLNCMDDEARRLGGYRVQLSASDIAERTGILKRRVFHVLRDLRERGLIDVETATNKYGHEPNTYVILPPGKGRMEKVEQVSQRLGVPRAHAAEYLQRLWRVRDSAGTLSLQEFADQAGWTRDPHKFATALIEVGILQNGRIVW